MVVGVKTNTPHVITASLEVSIHGNWLADEMDGCISLLECLLYRGVEKYWRFLTVFCCNFAYFDQNMPVNEVLQGIFGTFQLDTNLYGL